MAGNINSAVDSLTPRRGRRAAAASDEGTKAPVRGVRPAKQAAVVEADEGANQVASEAPAPAAAPKKRGPKPGSKQSKPREPKAPKVAGGFDAGTVTKQLKAQVKALKAQLKAEEKAYAAASKKAEDEQTKLTKAREKLTKVYEAKVKALTAGLEKAELTLVALEQ